MRAACLICADLFEATNNVVSTPCGHTFHEICLLQWLNHSQTCPSCRKAVRNKQVLRLFFDIAEQNDEDPASLQNQVDDLRAQLRQKDMDKMQLNEKIENFRQYVLTKEEEVQKYKDKFFDASSEVTQLKSDMKLMRAEASQRVKLVEEVSRLQAQVDGFRNLNKIMSGTVQEAEYLLSTYTEGPGALRQMATYCCLLKRELQNATDAKNQLQSEVGRLRKDLGFKISEISEKNAALKASMSEISQLKEVIEQLEKDKESLKKKVSAFQDSISSPTRSSHSAISRLVAESPAPENMKRPRLTDPEEDSPSPIVRSPPVKVTSKGLSIKTNTLPAPKDKGLNVSLSVKGKNNFFRPASLLQTDESKIRTGYNGFGGHSKFIVPRSIKRPKF